MSLIHISITKKDTNEFVASQGFCRTSGLAFFCRDEQNEKIRNFELDISMGLDVKKENINNFLHEIQYVIDYLRSIPVQKRANHFKRYKEDSYLYFINCLESSKQYLEEFANQNNLDDFIIMVIP